VKRYQQQIQLPEIGEEGQQKISQASVLVVGAGGLGTVVATYLVAMGIGEVGIVDFDTIEESNLHRQFLYSSNDIGKNKAIVLTSKLKKQNEHLTICAFDKELTNSNFDEIIKNYSIVCDCTDNLNTRLLIDKKCFANEIPLVHGAVSEWQGYITLLHHKNKFQYQDLFDIKTLLQVDSCESKGISSPVCGIIGSLMSNEVVKIILGIESNLDGGLLYVNGLINKFKFLKLKKFRTI
jgi:molybdopterin/thiamine biosynthesis adenylyltransferase